MARNSPNSSMNASARIPRSPRLEWAAEWIVEQDAILEQIIETPADDTRKRCRSTCGQGQPGQPPAAGGRADRVASVLPFGSIVAYSPRWRSQWKASSRLRTAIFPIACRSTRTTRSAGLSSSFNRLSDRMDTLRQLLTRLEQGADLEGTLRVAVGDPAITDPGRLDRRAGDRRRRAHPSAKRHSATASPTRSASSASSRTRPCSKECIRNRAPLHISDVTEMAALSESLRLPAPPVRTGSA